MIENKLTISMMVSLSTDLANPISTIFFLKFSKLPENCCNLHLKMIKFYYAIEKRQAFFDINVDGQRIMATSTGLKKNSDLRKEIRRGMDRKIQIFLIFGVLCVCGALVVDILKDMGIMNQSSETDSTICAAVRDIKRKFLVDMDKYCNLVMTLNTILAAAVIFFYSVQDSRKGGIPHRTILAYTLGAFTVPILFVVTLVMLPFCYVAYSLNFNWTVYISLLFTYIIQILIVMCILASTSYQYSVCAITNVEFRQFQALNARSGLPEKDQAKVEQNPFFTWTYLQHHLEQITLSDELVADKMLVTRRILRVPYYEREIRLKEELLESVKKHGQEPQMSLRRLETNNLESIYEFYNGNLLVVFKHIDRPASLEYRNKMYLILYEFLEELTELYETSKDERNMCDTYRNNYLMTVAGIINAVLDSDVEEASTFCKYVFNHIISEDVWNDQITLYIIFQEYLYRINENALRHMDFMGIDGIRGWESNIENKQSLDLYEKFWNAWIRLTTISSYDAYRYFDQVVRALKGEMAGGDPVTYVMRIVK